MNRGFLKLPTIALCLFAGVLISCNIVLPNPLTAGAPFIVKGTADEVPLFGGGSCRIWRGENGVVYHLFQDVSVDGAQFDLVTTPGTTSRLQMVKREDLDVGCKMGPPVVVTKILEIF